MMWKRDLILKSSILLVACAMSSGCHTVSLHDADTVSHKASRFVKTELYFGLSRLDGNVSQEEWQAFVDDYVTPRFEEGLIVVKGKGQYWSRGGDFVREKTRIIILVHENTVAADGSIEFIRASYKRLFDQESVMRLTVPVSVSFEETVVMPRVVRLAVLENQLIDESSGLAFSSRQSLFWTHNDSGGQPRFFAFDRVGMHWGTFVLATAQADDWEDMCSAQLDGVSMLLFADVGDNKSKRSSYTLYLVKEPLVETARDADPVLTELTVPVEQVIHFMYEDGPRNCEGVAFDAETRTVYLVQKNNGWHCAVYALSLPAVSTEALLVAQKVGEIAVPLTTGFDISLDGRRAVVLTYGDAYEYRRKEGESWATAFTRDPRIIPMPKRDQGESICYGPAGRHLYLTSENLPAPLWEVTMPEE